MNDGEYRPIAIGAHTTAPSHKTATSVSYNHEIVRISMEHGRANTVCARTFALIAHLMGVLSVCVFRSRVRAFECVRTFFEKMCLALHHTHTRPGSDTAHFVSVQSSGGYLVRTLAPIASEPSALCHHHSYIGLIVLKLWLSTELPLRRPTIPHTIRPIFFLCSHTPEPAQRRQPHRRPTSEQTVFRAGIFGLASPVWPKGEKTRSRLEQESPCFLSATACSPRNRRRICK